MATINKAEVKRLMGVRGATMLVDTSVLIAGIDYSEFERKVISDFCAQNSVIICDTVYWEFLRNTNLVTFRKRFSTLQAWPGSQTDEGEVFLPDKKDAKKIQAVKVKTILPLPINTKSKRVYKSLNALILERTKEKPLSFLIRDENDMRDMWIAATSVGYRIDNVLTTDRQKGFHPSIFSSSNYKISKRLTISLKHFKRNLAEQTWFNMSRRGSITVKIDPGQFN